MTRLLHILHIAFGHARSTGVSARVASTPGTLDFLTFAR